MNHFSNVDDLSRMRREYLDSIRGLLAPQYRHMGDSQVAELLRNSFENMSHAEQEAFAAFSLQNAQENFFSDIGRGLSQFARAAPGILRTVAPIAQTALPIVGTLVGGPAGTAIGGALGGLLGNLAGGGNSGNTNQKMPRHSPLPQTGLQTVGQPQVPTNPSVNPAAAQLMSLLNNPQLIQALLGQVLGRVGNGSASAQTTTQQTPIPFGALMNTISELAERAAEESIQTGSYASESYLMNGVGQYRVMDPSSREQRADAVMELLNEDYYYRRSSSAVQYPSSQEDAGYDQVSEWLVSAGLIK